MEPQLSVLINVIIATTLTGIVGFERERAEKPAGFRTNMIVGGASCLLVNLTYILSSTLESAFSPNIIQADPLRVLEAIVVGVSFIGGGTILKSPQKQKVKNLTTAATLLYSAGIGISVALEQYLLASGLSALALLVNHVIGWIENRLNGNK
jgi:putative Mg2+ transporter-C (MgtC) family protein